MLTVPAKSHQTNSTPSSHTHRSKPPETRRWSTTQVKSISERPSLSLSSACEERDVFFSRTFSGSFRNASSVHTSEEDICWNINVCPDAAKSADITIIQTVERRQALRHPNTPRPVPHTHTHTHMERESAESDHVKSVCERHWAFNSP